MGVKTMMNVVWLGKKKKEKKTQPNKTAYGKGTKEGFERR